MSDPAYKPRSNSPPPVMPVLRSVWPEADIPDALRAAFDARTQDKAALSAMADELLAQLQPEITRLTQELVNGSIDKLWRKRFPSNF